MWGKSMELSAIQQEMRSMTLDAAGSAGKVTASNTAQSSAVDFSALLGNAINHVNGLQKSANTQATRFDAGDRTVGLSDVMIAGQKSSVAFEATVQVRNKLVEAYKEIMSMPV
ncbi:MAG: flagellar hook-basal body complex protein FliE [Plesiomonas sp.]